MKKTASIPSLRVKPKLRHAVEEVLQEGETLSSFVEQSLWANIAHRQAQREFISRGLLSQNEAQKTGEYIWAEEVLNELDQMLVRAEKEADA